MSANSTDSPDGNIFLLEKILFSGKEIFEPLIKGRNLLIERIISTGQSTASGEFYDQERDEWVILLQGEALLSFEDGRNVRLRRGDYTFIAAHVRHRVEQTSSEPPCIWLAVHAPRMQEL